MVFLIHIAILVTEPLMCSDPYHYAALEDNLYTSTGMFCGSVVKSVAVTPFKNNKTTELHNVMVYRSMDWVQC
jgi:hypothetical protein